AHMDGDRRGFCSLEPPHPTRIACRVAQYRPAVAGRWRACSLPGHGQCLAGYRVRLSDAAHIALGASVALGGAYVHHRLCLSRYIASLGAGTRLIAGYSWIRQSQAVSITRLAVVARRNRAAWIGSVPLCLSTYTSNASQAGKQPRSEEHTSELQSRENIVCRLL